LQIAVQPFSSHTVKGAVEPGSDRLADDACAMSGAKRLGATRRLHRVRRADGRVADGVGVGVGDAAAHVDRTGAFARRHRRARHHLAQAMKVPPKSVGRHVDVPGELARGDAAVAPGHGPDPEEDRSGARTTQAAKGRGDEDRESVLVFAGDVRELAGAARRVACRTTDLTIGPAKAADEVARCFLGGECWMVGGENGADELFHSGRNAGDVPRASSWSGTQQ
jgi:hypothetical protein